MPDVVLMVRGLDSAEEQDRLSRLLDRLQLVKTVNVDLTHGLVAVSFTGGRQQLEEIEQKIREAGYEVEPSPGVEHGFNE